MKGRVVFGVIGNDIHVVANRILEIGLQAAELEAINLRTYNEPSDFVDAARETYAEAVLISSLNGEGEKWCGGIRKLFQKAGLQHICLYAGGNLVVGHRPEKEVVRLFQNFGFNRVFYQACDFDEMITLLKEDISDVRKQRQQNS